MKIALSMHWITAAWRESARTGARAIDVDHLYLGLLALGGAAARLLGRHGISLASARERAKEAQADGVRALGLDPTPLELPPRPLTDLGEADVQFTAPARALYDDLVKAPDSFALLVGLLKGSEQVRRLVDADGVAPNELVPELRAGSDDPVRAEPVPPTPGLLPAPARAVRISGFVSLPPERLAAVLADPVSLTWWAYDPDRAEVTPGGEAARLRVGRSTMGVRFHLTQRESEGRHSLAWLEEITDGEFAGQPLRHDRFDIVPAPGGSELTMTRSYRLFRLSGRLLAPFTGWMIAIGTRHTLQMIAYGAAESPQAG